MAPCKLQQRCGGERSGLRNSHNVALGAGDSEEEHGVTTSGLLYKPQQQGLC